MLVGSVDIGPPGSAFRNVNIPCNFIQLYIVAKMFVRVCAGGYCQFISSWLELCCPNVR